MSVDGLEAFVANGILTHNCSYRMEGNKNSTAFDESKSLPERSLSGLLGDFKELGVQGIEVTGGGEPLAYGPHRTLWRLLGEHGFDTALVTNGTLLTEEKAAAVMDTSIQWIRVSIDAARPETYERMRKAPDHHFGRAWRAVDTFRRLDGRRPNFRLGVGFVLSNENVEEVYDFVALAKLHGADNVRLSATFSDAHQSYFQDWGRVQFAVEESLRAKLDFEDETFTVHNLLPIRLHEIEAPHQDYRACPTQRVLCVVEGEGRVYTCCTFTGSPHGIQGNFLAHPGGFKGLWLEREDWRRRLDPRQYCQVSCLYRKRNLDMLQLIDAPAMPPEQAHLHQSFV